MTIETAITVNIISTFIMLFTYMYLYLQYRHIYIAKWWIAWVILAIRQVFFDRDFAAQTLAPPLVCIYGLLTAIYCLFMIAGTLEFANRRLSKMWIVFGILVLIAFCTGALLLFPFQYYSWPGIIFMGAIYISTGVIFGRIDIPGGGKYFTAGVFVLLGIHFLDMPLLLPVKWFAAWGFLLDGILKLCVAIGIIFVYFEKVRYDLSEQEKYYRLLAENATDVIYRYRLAMPQGFEFISPAVEQLTGCEPRFFKTISQVMHLIYPDDRRKFKEFRRTITKGGKLVGLRIVNKNGEMVWVEQKFSLVYDTDGQAIAVEGIVRDVTSRVLLEQDVARLDRLNIAGQMAASLAHEIRNPLSTVSGYLQLMGQREEFENYKGRLTMMLEEIERTNGIITEYLLLSKGKIAQMKKANLNNIITAIHPLIEVDAAASGVTVVLELGEIPNIALDGNEIKQLLLNLVRNGIEAMQFGGRLAIRTAEVGGEVVLSVQDEGPGIPLEVLDNMGKPFLTTKEKGTGLGMAVCYRIAGRHNTKLDYDTGPAGTTANLRFPNF